jgi:hypothetical protein
MDYYYRENFFTSQQKIKLTNDNLILSNSISKSEKEEVARIPYSNIISIELRAKFIGGKYARWEYSTKIYATNIKKPIIVWCKNQEKHGKDYTVLLQNLHTHCEFNTNIKYSFYDDHIKTNKKFDEYDLGFYVIMVVIWLFTIPKEHTFWFIVFLVFLSNIKEMIRNQIDGTNKLVFGEYKSNAIPINVLP